MIAVDTNRLVCFLTGDDKQQFEKSLALFESHDVFIPDTVIPKSEWVLRYAYRFTPDAICSALDKLFGLLNVHLTNPTLISQALRWHERGLDFADAMHLVLSRQCEWLYTFDAEFARRAKGLCKSTVLKP